MIKLSLLAALVGGFAMNGPSVKSALSPIIGKEELDASIIVEVDRSLDSLTEEGIVNTQTAVYNTIKNYVTRNIEYHSSFNVLNNAFVININSRYINSVKSLPGVKSVTENKFHVFDLETVQHPLDDPKHPDPVHDYGGSENASAKTMDKPDDTNDGEGTVIAILDNEFNFRAATDSSAAWSHDTFSPLPAGTKMRFGEQKLVKDLGLYPYTSYTYIDDKRTVRWQDTIEKTALGYEGSCYFNNKVPYYFDYGGEKTAHGLSYDDFEDFDVSSEIAYHGSHVASIAAGNDPCYKGIAPKAQLVCMKVFTNYEANETDKKLGFQSSSGAYDVPILHALEDCVKLGVDGINMSLGSNLNDFDSDSITMKTLVTLQEAGLLAAISAGNDGKESYSFAGGYGNWTKDVVETGILGGYANSPASTIVASGHPNKKFYQQAFKITTPNSGVEYIEYEDQVKNYGNNKEYTEEEERKLYDELVVKKGLTSVSWQMVPGFGAASDYKNIVVEDKIAVVMRGQIDFWTKYNNAKDAGAIAVIFINNDPTASDFNFHCSFGEGNKPEIPVVIVLYRDVKYFTTGEKKGTFQVIKDESGDNIRAGTLSSFTSDGATYDLDLNPDITAPGDNIRGAVPPQSKDDKDYRPTSTYEFLSGTSMSSPNFAGAQALLTSKWAKDVYADGVATEEELAALTAKRRTVSMRYMSTATPLVDFDENPEVGGEERTIASPRRQGAGMANIRRAYNTDIYFEGLDKAGKGTGVAKMPIKDIPANGFNFSFLAHNEGEAKTYNVTLTVMRTAIAESNDIVSRNYNDQGEVEDIDLFPGHTKYEAIYDEELGKVVAVPTEIKGDLKVGDVYRVSREIEYYDDAEACLLDYQEGKEIRKHKIAIGKYVYDPESPKANKDGWRDLEKLEYTSTQDVIIDTVSLGEKVIAANTDTTINVSYTMPQAERDNIAEKFPYGCYVEGYVSFTNKNEATDKLSMVYMGFYTGSEKTYKDAPVVEPFGFEKLGENKSIVYPSELVNDIAKTLLGKTDAEFGSTWISTYIEPGKAFGQEENVLLSNESLEHLAMTNDDYHLAGTDDKNNYYDDPANNIYVGNKNHTNTMIIQQFMLRSVSDNYYTITNKDTGEVVRTDVLEDSLYGEIMGKWPLFKSHVDSSFLGSGVIAHKAMAVIPLYDTTTGEMFESGNYEIKFHYILAGTGDEVIKPYNFIVDSENPTVNDVKVVGNNLRIDVEDNNFSSASVGSYVAEVKNDSNGDYLEVPLYQAMMSLNQTLAVYDGRRIGRLSVSLKDKAFGEVHAVIKFEESTISGSDKLRKLQDYAAEARAVVDKEGNRVYSEAEVNAITSGRYLPNFAKCICAVNEFFDGEVDITENEEGVVKFHKIVGSTPTDYTPTGEVKIIRCSTSSGGSSSGCRGSVETTSITLATLAGALALVTLLALRKRKLGGK